MINLIRELHIRQEEVENFIIFAEKLEEPVNLNNGNGESFDTLMVRTNLKSSIILMLYNTVESIITKSLNRVHDILIGKNLMYNELNDHLKKITLIYYQSVINGNNNLSNSTEKLFDILELVRGNNLFTLSYEELSKYYQLYSGNLDSREIISILEKYGVGFTEKISELKTIKDYRNKLAHGELSFEEAGRNLSIEQLKVMKDKTFQYIEKIILALDAYINNERYRKFLE